MSDEGNEVVSQSVADSVLSAISGGHEVLKAPTVYESESAHQGAAALGEHESREKLQRKPMGMSHSENLVTMPLIKSQEVLSSFARSPSSIYQFTLTREHDGAVWLLNSPTISLGRSKNAQLRVSDSITVSRQHAMLYVEENLIELKDLGSSNGTYINGLRLAPYQKVRVVPNDRITFGDQVFLLL